VKRGIFFRYPPARQPINEEWADQCQYGYKTVTVRAGLQSRLKMGRFGQVD
jgi:hypothetical protein